MRSARRCMRLLRPYGNTRNHGEGRNDCRPQEGKGHHALIPAPAPERKVTFRGILGSYPCPYARTGHHPRMDPASTQPAHEIISRLGLQPHPEGGFYAETFRSHLKVTLPDGRERSAGTAIHFLLPAGSFSALHRVSSDETWHHYQGSPLELLLIHPDGRAVMLLLGGDLSRGERPHAVVPAGVWQGARPLSAKVDGGGYSFVGCTVAPGFEFEDFEMPGRAALLELFPEHQDMILEFTNP